MEGTGGWNGVHPEAKEKWEAEGRNKWPRLRNNAPDGSGDGAVKRPPGRPRKHPADTTKATGDRKSADLNVLMSDDHLSKPAPAGVPPSGADSLRQEGVAGVSTGLGKPEAPSCDVATARPGAAGAAAKKGAPNSSTSVALEGAANSIAPAGRMEPPAAPMTKAPSGKTEAATKALSGGGKAAPAGRDGQPAPSTAPPAAKRSSSTGGTPAPPHKRGHNFFEVSLRAVEEWRKLRHKLQAAPRPSSVQAMGLTMSNELFREGRAAMDATIQAHNVGSRSRPGNAHALPISIVDWDNMAWSAGISFAPQERAAVEAGVRAFLEPMARHFMASETLPPKMPPLFDKIQPGFIDKADPRGELRCQECLRTTDYVPRGTVLGPLAGSLLTLEEHHAWKYSADLPPGTERCWWDAVHAAYALELNSPDIKRAFPWANGPLVLSMAREANHMALINDPTISPFAYSAPATPTVVSPPNVAPLVVSFLGLPVVLVVAICDITPYQELLYCYGRGYWDKLRERLRAAQVAGAP